MAFDLHKLARAAEFSFSLGSVGLVRCTSLTSDLMSQARHRLKASEAVGKETELARWMLGQMAKRPAVEDFKESDPIDGESLTSEQLAAIPDQELEFFSEQVLKKNSYLVKSHGSAELKRIEGQSACEFLAHAIEHRAKEEKAQIDRIIQSATKPLFADSTLDAIKKSVNASNRYEDLIKQYAGGSILDSLKQSIATPNSIESLAKKYADQASVTVGSLTAAEIQPQILRFDPPHIPRNPILETNQILENLTGLIEGMRPLVAQGAELIRSMNDTALRMQADYITNAERSDHQTKNAMRIAVLSLVVSAVGLIASSWFSYQTYADGKVAAEESKVQGAAFENRHKDLMTAQHEDRLLLIKAIADLKQPVPAGKK